MTGRSSLAGRASLHVRTREIIKPAWKPLKTKHSVAFGAQYAFEGRLPRRRFLSSQAVGAAVTWLAFFARAKDTELKFWKSGLDPLRGH